MAEPGLTRKRVLAAKVEVTPGTAEVLAAADGQFVAYDPEINPDIDFEERPPAQGSFSQPAGVTNGEKGTISFTTDVFGCAAPSTSGIDIDAPALQFTNIQAGDRNKLDVENISFQLNKSAAAGDDEMSITFEGAAAIPMWAQTFLPACGFVAVGRVYSPVSEPPGTNVKTITIAVYKDGRFFQLAGAVGTFVIRMVNGMLVKVDWTFTGIWTTPSDVAILTPTYPTIPPLRFKGTTFTINAGSVAWPRRIAEATIDIGNEVVMRENAQVASGYSHAVIVDRKITGTVDPESVLVATEPDYADWLNLLLKQLHIEL